MQAMGTMRNTGSPSGDRSADQLATRERQAGPFGMAERLVVPMKPGKVPTLYIWGSQDLALGATAAIETAGYVTGPYRFEKLEGRSHWLLEEIPDQVSALVLEHIRANLVR